ncbi:hypothetical protein EDM80_14625 [bacterium]|nr:MAG: hypothetical protein EDM80_14625 [bacterium]RIK63849.1 MAG: hypothetical protein DCC64_05430 [Planctomycetota bacterium]
MDIAMSGHPLQLALVVAGLFLILGSMVLPRLLRRVNRHKPRVSGTVAFVPTAGQERQLAAARELLEHLDELSRRSFSRLDAKMCLLNRLIEDADVRLRALARKESPHG